MSTSDLCECQCFTYSSYIALDLINWFYRPTEPVSWPSDYFIYSSVFMSFITVFNFSLSRAITLSSIHFRRIENIMLSGLLAFVQTTLLIKTVQLCSKLIFAKG